MKKNKVLWLVMILLGVLLLYWFLVPGNLSRVLEDEITLEQIQRVEIQKTGGPYALAEDTTEITDPGQIAEFYNALRDVSVLRWFSQSTHTSMGEKKIYAVFLEGEESTVYFSFSPSSFPWYYVTIGNEEFICWK